MRESALRLTRVFVDAELISGSIAELPKDTASHLARVLRARVGDELLLFNGDGREFSGTLESIRGTKVSAAIGTGLAVDRESPLSVTLLQCVPRGDRMDFIVQKATELGVACIVPVLSQRSVVRLDDDQAESKRAHWQAVAVSACEQCGRNRLPVIATPLSLTAYLGALPADDSLRLVFEPASQAAAPVATSKAAVSVILAIGPEGGFAADELEAFDLSRFRRGSLGPRVLRTETAALAALTWLQVRYGDMSVDS